MLEVKNLHQKYHEKTVLHDVSFSQPQGTVTAIIGPSGSGKTTLLRTLNALVQPEKGQISIGDATVDLNINQNKILNTFAINPRWSFKTIISSVIKQH